MTMTRSRQLAGLIGPVLIAIAVTEAMNLRLLTSELARGTTHVVYLNGTLLFVAGLAIVRAHNTWTGGWPVLITVTGWLSMLLGLIRMFAPAAGAEFGLDVQRPDEGQFVVYTMLFVLFAMGVVLTFNARPPSVRTSAEERSRPLPGDDLIAEPLSTVTHAITIDGGASEVWPWLAQMGAGARAGWYSYDLLDNKRQPSAERIVPELLSLAPGMIFPAMPGVTDCFTLVAFEPGHFLILGWRPKDRLVMTWAFVLADAAHGSCRLLVRARTGAGYDVHALPAWLSSRLGPVIHFVMQRKQLLGIKRRVERDAAARALSAGDRTAART